MTYLMDCKPSIESCTALTRELEALAVEARELMQLVPGRVKFDLHTTHGWHTLQEALTSERFTKSLSAEALLRLRTCAVRWISLYRHLLFVASTRPVWNS